MEKFIQEFNNESLVNKILLFICLILFIISISIITSVISLIWNPCLFTFKLLITLAILWCIFLAIYDFLNTLSEEFYMYAAQCIYDDSILYNKYADILFELGYQKQKDKQYSRFRKIISRIY